METEERKREKDEAGAFVVSEGVLLDQVKFLRSELSKERSKHEGEVLELVKRAAANETDLREEIKRLRNSLEQIQIDWGIERNASKSEKNELELASDLKSELKEANGQISTLRSLLFLQNSPCFTNTAGSPCLYPENPLGTVSQSSSEKLNLIWTPQNLLVDNLKGNFVPAETLIRLVGAVQSLRKQLLLLRAEVLCLNHASSETIAWLSENLNNVLRPRP